MEPGYHKRTITKGQLGEASKIIEEAEEFADAVDQGASIMAIMELSDICGAIDAYLAKHHPSITIIDLRIMSSITKRAFQNGHRH
jgi:phosphoribosyl-ATP pyrophosphohydrolase